MGAKHTKEKITYPQSIAHAGKKFTLDPLPLGSGTFGVVYHASHKDPKTGKEEHLAVKFELPNSEGKYDSANDFVREARKYQLVYGLGTISGNLRSQDRPRRLVMPFFAGKSIKALADRNSSLLTDDVNVMLRVGILLLAAVDQFHKNFSLVHCDLSIHNVLISPTLEQAFLIDFGGATFNGTTRLDCCISETSHNRLNNTDLSFDEIRRTYFYFPPEFFSANGITITANFSQDIYSAAALFKFLSAAYVRANPHSTNDFSIKLNYILSLMMNDRPLHRMPLHDGICSIISAFFTKLAEIVSSKPEWNIIISAILQTQIQKLKVQISCIKPLSKLLTIKTAKKEAVEQLLLALQNSPSPSVFVEKDLTCLLSKSVFAGAHTSNTYNTLICVKEIADRFCIESSR